MSGYRAKEEKYRLCSTLCQVSQAKKSVWESWRGMTYIIGDQTGGTSRGRNTPGDLNRLNPRHGHVWTAGERKKGIWM